MKIAMLQVDLPNCSKGGVPAQAHHLANHLVRYGHAVTMFSYSPAFDECLYHVHQYASPPPLKFLQPFSFAAAVASTDFSSFDVIHAHGDSYLLSQKYPHLRTFHGSAIDEMLTAMTWRRRLYQLLTAGLEKWNSKISSLNVGVSDATRQRIPEVSKVIPCGVNIDHFHPGLKSSSPSILFVGAVNGRKRGALLAKIFLNQIHPKLPEAELWSVTDEPMNGEGIVNFGRVSHEELCELYRKAWVLCLPSTYEGFGVPYIEAMASATAVVASPNPGACEILDNGRYGVIANDDELGNSLTRILGEQRLREQYADQGISRAQKYSWDSIVKAYEKAYGEAIQLNLLRRVHRF